MAKTHWSSRSVLVPFCGLGGAGTSRDASNPREEVWDAEAIGVLFVGNRWMSEKVEKRSGGLLWFVMAADWTLNSGQAERRVYCCSSRGSSSS
jgi:hypothetical protein